MSNVIETQGMIQRTTDFTKDSSQQLHRTDVSQDSFTREMKVRSQRELQQTVGVSSTDGDIRIRENREEGAKGRDGGYKKGRRKKAKPPSGDVRPEDGSDSQFDIRI